MRKLQMSAKEILDSYKNAKDPAAQIRILAELNAVTQKEIEEVLRGLGVELPQKRPGRKRKEALPEAEEIPVKLEPIPAQTEQKEEEVGQVEGKPVRSAMSVAALAEILRRVAEAYPETELRIREGCRVPDTATLTVRWDEQGEAARTVLEIGG